MNIFDPQVSGSLSVSGSGQISGDLTVLGTLFATVSGTTQNAVSASHAAAYTLTSSFHQFTSSYNTGSFSGSFVGDGTGLFNIPASGVTGLNLSSISDGSATASISQANGLLVNVNTEITGNLTVTGRLTAQEYHTELVSASIIYESGSSKFGDTLDDTHQITGSVDISGSLKANNVALAIDRLINISVSDAGGKYFIDNVRNPTLTLIKGYTYKFLYPNIGAHPFRFSTTNDGTHNGGTTYSTGVTTGATPDYIQIEVTDSTPSTLHYYCTAHPGMGNTISVLGDILNNEADRAVVYIEPARIATTGSNTFTGSQIVSGSLSVTGSVEITGSISLNGQPIGTGKLDETVFNTYTSSNDGRVSALEISTGSLNSFTSSIDSTIKTKMNNDGVVSGSLQINITGTTGYSTFSSSIATTDSNQENRLGSIETSTGSLNTFSSSASSRLGSLESASGSIRSDFNSYTSSNDTTNTTQNGRLTSLESASSSIRNDFNSYTSSNNSTNTTQNGRLDSLESTTSSLNTFSSSTANNLLSLETASGSIRTDFNSYTSSNDSTNTTQNNRLNNIETSTGSLNVFTTSINSFTSSIDSTIKTKLNTEGVISGSAQVNITSTTGYSTFSSSIATTDLNQENRLTSLEGKTGSYATTGSNIFQGNQTITGSLYISQDLIVAGSSSIQNISSSIVNIADNIITVNALNPAIRFGGLAVIDSGSSPQVSGSMLFDSINNQWLFVHQNQSAVTSSVLLMGPETFNNLGGETYLTQNRIPKGTGIEHLNDSNITDTGAKVSINSNTEVTGTLVVTQNISSPNISAIQTATGSLNSFTSSVLTAIELTGSNLTVKGNLLVKGTTTNVNTTTLDVDNNLINLNGTGASFAGLRVKDTTAPNQISGSLLWDATNDYWIAGQLGSEQRLIRETEFNNAVTRIGNVETSTSSLNSFTSSINTTIKNKLNNDSVISGSSQVNHNATTNYDSNQHIDHTSVSITAGNGLSGGGTIAATRTITLDTGSTHFTNGVKSKMNTDGVVSGSSQITYGSISGIPSGIVSGSSQVNHNATTNYDSNQHIDHTAVSISAGNGMSGGGTIAATRTLTLDTGSNHFITGSRKTIVATSSPGASGIVFSFDTGSGIFTGTLANSAITIAGTSTSLGGTISAATILSGTGVVSGSAQLTSIFVQKSGDTMTGALAGTSATFSGQFVQGGGAARSTSGTTISLTVNSGFTANSDISDANRFFTIVNNSTTTNAYAALSFRINPAGSANNAMFDLRLANGSASNNSSTLYWTFNDGGTFSDRMSLSSGGNLTVGGNIRTATSTSNVVKYSSGSASVTFGNSLGANATDTSRTVFFRGASSTASVWWGGPDANGDNIPHGAIDSLSTGGLTHWYNSAGTGGGTWTKIMTVDGSGITANSGNFIGNLTGNASGTANNITAYTINQSVGTANAPTFAGLTVGNGVATGRSSYGITNANIILTSSAADATGYCGIDFRSGNNYPSDGAQIYYENNSGGTSERAKLTIRVENDQEDFMEIRAGRIDINSNTVSGGGQATLVNFQSAGSTVAYVTSGGAIYARSGNLVKDFGNSTYSTSFSNVSSVTVTHSLGSKDVMVMCYDNNDEMFWPSSIVTTSTSVVTITFAANRTGRVVVLR